MGDSPMIFHPVILWPVWNAPFTTCRPQDPSDSNLSPGWWTSKSVWNFVRNAQFTLGLSIKMLFIFFTFNSFTPFLKCLRRSSAVARPRNTECIEIRPGFCHYQNNDLYVHLSSFHYFIQCFIKADHYRNFWIWHGNMETDQNWQHN